jgi:hypothetical protein
MPNNLRKRFIVKGLSVECSAYFDLKSPYVEAQSGWKRFRNQGQKQFGDPSKASDQGATLPIPSRVLASRS